MKALTAMRSRIINTVLLIIVFILILIPCGISLFMSFMKIDVASGLPTGGFMGFKIYQDLFSSIYLPRLLINSLGLWLSSMIVAVVIGLAAALLCGKIKNLTVRASCAGLFLLPVFVPAAVYLQWFRLLLPTALDNQDLNYAFWGYYAAKSCWYGAALIAFAGSAVGLVFSARGKGATRGILMGSTAAVLIQGFSSLQPSYEILQLSYNGHLFRVAESFDTFVFRSTLQNGSGSYSAASYVIRVILQIFINIGLAFLLALWLRRQRRLGDADQLILSPQTVPSISVKSMPWVVAILLAIIILLVTGLPDFSSNPFIPHPLPALAMVVLSALVGIIMSTIMIMALKQAGQTFFILFTGISLSVTGSVSGFYYFGELSGLNKTVLALPLIVWMLPIFFQLVFIFSLVSRFSASNRGSIYFGASSAFLAATLAYGGYFPGVLFLSDSTPGIIFMKVVKVTMQLPELNFDSAADAQRIAYYMITMLPCLLAGFASIIFAIKGLKSIAFRSVRPTGSGENKQIR